MSDIPRRIREAAAASLVPKMLLIGLLILILLIPLQMIGGLVGERSRRRMEVEEEIVAQSGGRQTIAGPMLVVPFVERRIDDKGRVEETVRQAIFLPRALQIEARLAPQLRRRGIYEVTVYHADLAVSGSFGPVDFAPWRVASSDILWDKAAVVVEVTGMHGLRERVELAWSGRKALFGPARPATGESGLSAGALSAPLPMDAAAAGRDAAFGFGLALQGGASIGFLPFGEETRVRLASSWRSPSFNGSFLPAERSLGPEGFAADWRVLSLGRGYPQQWLSGDIERASLQASRFGVDLLIPVDGYLKSERSVKHGVHFVLLPFVALFLHEVGTRRRVHAMQYLLVGLAETLFYLLLLSLSEHMAFDLAYLVSASATIALVSSYASALLGGARGGAVAAAALTAAYGFLYGALQSQDNSLLIGSLGLFVVLAVVMLLTRRLDWYRLGESRAPTP
jgi:inner membrane protein